MSHLSVINVRIPSNGLSGSIVESVEDPAGTEHPITQSAPRWLRCNIHINGNIIEAIDQQAIDPAGQQLNGDGCFALPGFIDLHVHGGAGVDTMDADPISLHKMSRFFAEHGVTAFCPTTMTAPHQEILSAVKGVKKANDDVKHNAGARILGAHIEGPYISPLFPGAQPAEYVRQPSIDEFNELLQSGPVNMITLAPEVSGARELITQARRAGVLVVMGHTNASYDQCLDAATQGVTQATHTYNAMSGLHHRQPGTLGAVFNLDEIDAQLIADNIHVHPAAMNILYRCKGIERIILITDAMRAAGLPEGTYSLGGQAVTVSEGACRLADGTLAGSILTMDKALINFMDATELPLIEAWPTTSRNAARSLGLEKRFGTIDVGCVADLVLLDKSLSVIATIVDGKVIYIRDSQ